ILLSSLVGLVPACGKAGHDSPPPEPVPSPGPSGTILLEDFSGPFPSTNWAITTSSAAATGTQSVSVGNPAPSLAVTAEGPTEFFRARAVKSIPAAAFTVSLDLSVPAAGD